jgi:hypothetical protein
MMTTSFEFIKLYRNRTDTVLIFKNTLHTTPELFLYMSLDIHRFPANNRNVTLVGSWKTAGAGPLFLDLEFMNYERVFLINFLSDFLRVNICQIILCRLRLESWVFNFIYSNSGSLNQRKKGLTCYVDFIISTSPRAKTAAMDQNTESIC